ncbi:T9SS type A sorting domain-containing protein [Maribellus mangrovi]|uniref:T9SS type A sorting domain-containing protein n=1 Tax=Maribellus mangrovi TaxID=3133146 RepID=UPI0030EF2F71
MKKIYKKLRTTRMAMLLLLMGIFILSANMSFAKQNKIDSVAIGPQQGYVLPGETGSVTYLVTIYRAKDPGNNGELNIGLCLRNGDGSQIFSHDSISYSFDPAVPVMLWGQNIKDSVVTTTLTIHVDSAMNNTTAVEFGVRAWYPATTNDGCNIAIGDFEEALTGIFQLGVPPAIVCPANITQDTDEGECEADVSYSLNYISDTDLTLTEGQYHGIPEPDIYYSLDGTNYLPGDGSGLTYLKGTTTVYLRADNGLGQAAECNFDITVEDNEAPTWTTGSQELDTMLACDDDEGLILAQSWGPAATDNCGVTSIDKTPGAFIPSQECQQSGTITNTWKATDSSGNTSTVFTQVITIVDTVAPVWTTEEFALDSTLACDDGDGLTLVQGWYPVALDNCDADVSNILKVAGNFVPSLECDQSGSYTNTWTVTDDCGNTSAIYTQVITIIDTVAPVWTTEEFALDSTLACDDSEGLTLVQGWFPVAVDNCDADVTDIVKVPGEFVPSLECDQSGSYTNTWTATDDCGNTSAVYTQIITIIDTVAPVWTTEDFALDSTLACDDSEGLTLVQGWFPVAMDNCDANVTDIVKVTGEFVPSLECDQSGTYTNTWTVTDDCGNTSAVYTQIITIVDTVAPVWITEEFALDSTLSCDDAEGLTLVQGWFPIAMDNCDADVSDIQKVAGDFEASAECPQSGIYNNTWTVADDCGNISTVFSQLITIIDTTPPTLSLPEVDEFYPTDEATRCEGTERSFEATAVDNCGEATVTYKVGADTIEFPYFFEVGTTTVKVIAEDECGNAAIDSFNVVVKIPTTTEAFVSAEAARYCDEVTLYAEIDGECPDNKLTGNVDFYLDDTTFVGSAPAYPIPLGEAGYGKLRATLIYKIKVIPEANYDSDPRTVTAEFMPTSEYYAGSEDDTTLLIYPRKIDPFVAISGFYTDNMLAWTTGPNSSSGTITMAAIMKDNNDPEGDLRGADVTFCFVEIEGQDTTYKAIPSAKKLPAGLINILDGTYGAASADVQIDIRKVEEIKIGVILSGGYINDPAADPAIATVSLAKPTADGTAEGEGELANTNSEGMIKGASEETTSFNFNVEYNNKQTNPQGSMTIEVKSWYNPDGTLDGELHTYVIESNAINLFAIGPNSEFPLADNQAIFDAKANISEKMDDGSTVEIDGNSPLHVTFIDGDFDGREGLDSIGITYYRKDGGVWFSSYWDWSAVGVLENPVTLDQEVSGEITIWKEEAEVEVQASSKGNKNKSAFIPSDSQIAIDGPDLKVFPNPFKDQARFEFVSPVAAQAKIDIYNLAGQMVQTIFDEYIEENTYYNAEFQPVNQGSGLYFYKMQLGDQLYNGKLVYKKE